MLPDSMQNCKLHGVELDSFSGRIAQKLYPNAAIQIKGFEDTMFADNSFDLIIGNVPFGNFAVADRKYDKYKFNIHEYFFAKSLDKLRPGGLMALIVRTWFRAKNDIANRQYGAERAELLGAIRLPEPVCLESDGT
jgi:adenine-specific DNA methylase